MLISDQRYFAYTLVGIMKEHHHKELNDQFTLDDFNIIEISLMYSSLGKISVNSLQEILHLMQEVVRDIWQTKHQIPTYLDMREAFAPDAYYR